MDAFRNIARYLDLQHTGVAFAMLGISIFSLYSHIFSLAVVPLIWMGYRIGKEIGRQEAHNELANPTLTPLSTRLHP